MQSVGTLAEKRRILQLETLYDLALALSAQRAEQELVDELLGRVCAVLDPAAAVAVGPTATPDQRERIRIAADRTVDPELRIALERAIDEEAEDEAVAEALEALENERSA